MYTHMSTCNMHITGTIGGQDLLKLWKLAGGVLMRGADTILEGVWGGMFNCLECTGDPI